MRVIRCIERIAKHADFYISSIADNLIGGVKKILRSHFHRDSDSVMRDGYRESYGMYALGSSGTEGVSVSCPSAMPAVQSKPKPTPKSFPRVSDHLIVPERAREEVVRGKLMAMEPSDPPHADEQAHIASLIHTHSKPEYQSSVELATRVSQGNDFAADASIRKKGIDPLTGDRYLEELAFEVVNTQSHKSIENRARDLSERGVRRIFAIFVKEGWIGEWNPKNQAFDKLNPKDKIKDQALVRPIKVKALLDMAEGEKEISRALLVKNNEVLTKHVEKAKKAAFQEGREEGLKLARLALMDVIQERFGSVPPALEARIQTLPAEELQGLIKRALKAERIEELG